VLAFVPDGALNRFFILTQDEANADIEKNTSDWRKRDAARADAEDRMPGVSQKYAKEHKDCWVKLPQ
jgi:hypothetical protein